MVPQISGSINSSGKEPQRDCSEILSHGLSFPVSFCSVTGLPGGEMPLAAFRDVSAFKLYLSDVGLLTAFVNIPAENLIRNELSDLFRGALAENYVAQALRAGGHQLYYWTSETPAAELDFVLQKEGKIIPVEVKPGKNTHARSLKHFRNLYQPEMALRLSEKNFGLEEGVFAVPLYAAFCI